MKGLNNIQDSQLTFTNVNVCLIANNSSLISVQSGNRSPFKPEADDDDECWNIAISETFNI